MKHILLLIFCLYAITSFASDITMGVSGASDVNISNHYAGLIASYSLDTTSMTSATTICDESGHGNTGTITAGASTWFEADPWGIANSAFDFDGANTKINCGSDFIGTQAITISCWIYLDSAGESDGSARIIDNGKTILRYYIGGTLNRLYFSSDGVTSAQSSNDAISLNNWLHIIVTRANDADAHTNYYINGKLFGTANLHSATAGPVTGTTNVIIGNNNAQQYTFDGRISDLHIYNEVKSATWVWEDFMISNDNINMGN